MIDPVPMRVPGLKSVEKIYGGGYSMCAVHVDRTVTCWGPDQSTNPYGAHPGDLFVVEGLANVVELSVATSQARALCAVGGPWSHRTGPERRCLVGSSRGVRSARERHHEVLGREARG